MSETDQGEARSSQRHRVEGCGYKPSDTRAARSWKRQGRIFPCSRADTLILDFRPPNWRRANFASFDPLFVVLGHGCPRTLTLVLPSFPRPQLSPHWNNQTQTTNTGRSILGSCSVHFSVWFSLCSVLLVRSASPDPESLTLVAVRIPFVLACELPCPLGF